MNHRYLAALSVVIASAVASGPSVAAPDEFFVGKTITLLSSADSASGYTAYTRLLSRYIPKYIPGSPTIVVQEEPGAGGLRAAQDIYAVAVKDGTKIANLRASNLLDSILNIRGGDIDPRKFEWIGNMASDTDLCSFWSTAGIRTFDDLRHKEVIVGASGKGAQNYMFPSAINSILHTRMKIVVGYSGMGDRVVAGERGELQGNCGINASSMISAYPQLLSSGKVIPIMQSGLSPYPAFPNVPLTQSFATNDHDRRVLTTIFSQMDIARVFAAPPGTPKDRVAILRSAFMQAAKDPALQAEAKKERLDIDPMSGEQVSKIIASMSDIPAGLKTEVRNAIGD